MQPNEALLHSENIYQWRPAARDGIEISPFNSHGDKPRYVVNDHSKKHYMITTSFGIDLLRLLNGEYTLAELREEFASRYQAAVSDTQIMQFLDMCQHNKLLAEGSWIEAGSITRKQPKRLREKLGFYKHLFAADAFLNWLARHRRWWLNPATLLVALILLASAVGFILFPPQTAGLTAPLNQIQYNNEDLYLALLPVLFLFQVGIHELAHGLACVLFGVRTGGFGFGLLWGVVPIFFTDTTDAYTLDNKYKRIAISAAGPVVDLLFLGGCALLVWFSAPGTLLHRFMLAYTALPLSALLINLNPFLIRVDGYWMLADFIEEPNLRRSTFKYLRTALARLLGRTPEEDVTITEITRSRQALYIVYALVAAIWTLSFVSLFVLSFIQSIFDMTARYSMLGF